MSVQGKTALVTGSTSGIGLGIASVLAAAGARVILNGFGDVEAAKTQVARLGAAPGYHGADLGDAAQIADMMQYAEREFGGVDILVNNAGIQHVFHTCRLALPGMRERHWGRIINVASVHGLVASKDKSAYVAAKHGVVGLTKTLALETARTPVTCNAICPGWVLTPLVQQQIDKRIAAGADPQRARDELLAEKQPSQEFVTPEQLGELALFLCSDAAAQVRGAAWNMDGGWLAQ
ncbi:SDR family oxidoreductase [Serratia marcescens]|uniref:SDR family oxidoreductase n=1 Tax=Serratia marcescens TaxID=615 RepID=UPI00041FB2FA|nr:SDR family oxidoreductase [Serratia marcescens]